MSTYRVKCLAVFQAIHRVRMDAPREQVRSYPIQRHALFLTSLGRTEFIREGSMSGDTQCADVPPPREQVRSYPIQRHALFLAPSPPEFKPDFSAQQAHSSSRSCCHVRRNALIFRRTKTSKLLSHKRKMSIFSGRFFAHHLIG